MKLKSLLYLTLLSAMLLGCASTKIENENPSYKLTSNAKTSDYVYYEALYPVFAGTEFKNLNKEIKSYVKARIKKFEEDAENAYEEMKNYPELLLGKQSDFHLETESVTYSGKIVSVLISLWYYEQGAAHGNFLYKSFNYDYSTGEFVTITDASEMSLEEISLECKNQLYKEKNADKAMIDFGTVPEMENFSTFTVDGNKITIYFDPYAVGPWATGTHEVHLNIK